MSATLAERAGPLLARAEAFAAQAGTPLELGPPGVAALTRRIETFLRGEGEIDEETDRLFVEGAGALLGVLLLDHLTGATHAVVDGVHALRVAESRIFDPFAAIDEALDAPNPRAALAASIRQAEAMREESSVNLEWAAVRALIVPRLWGRTFHDRLSGLGEIAQDVYSEPIAADVRLSLAVRHGNRVRFVRTEEMKRWEVDPRASLGAALTNLARASNGVRLQRNGALALVSAGDGLDAARLLLPEVRECLREEFGSPFLAAVPHRDALWACATKDRAALNALTAAEAALSAHRISESVLLVGTRSLSVSS